MRAGLHATPTNACLRFIEEWAHPLTIVNFTLIGLSSGMVLGCALAALVGDVVLIRSSGLGAIVITLVALGCSPAWRN